MNSTANKFSPGKQKKDKFLYYDNNKNKKMTQIPFSTFDWDNVIKIEHKGETGTSTWQTIQLGNLRIRIVEYSSNYLADHWCKKGHIVHCLEGEFISELNNGVKFTITKGMTYVVSDDLSTHRSISATGVKLLIIDGEFLNSKY